MLYDLHTQTPNQPFYPAAAATNIEDIQKYQQMAGTAAAAGYYDMSQYSMPTSQSMAAAGFPGECSLYTETVI